jgi:hypothetical protein
MSVLKTTKTQIGLSGSAVNNFVLISDETVGSLSLNRGTTDTVYSNVLSIDSTKKLAITGNLTISGNAKVATAPINDNSTKVANAAFVKSQLDYSVAQYGQPQQLTSAANNGSIASAVVLDSAGNIYWAIGNYYNGSTYSLTSYIYKLAVNGTLSTFASVATIGCYATALAIDSNDVLYWAVSNSYNGTTYTQTSYVYKITPDATLSTLASATTQAGVSCDLTFDSSGNLYWAVVNYYNGTTYVQTSYVYKIDVNTGTTVTFASATNTGAYGTAIKFDSLGNLYWAVSNYYTGSGSVYTQPSYVYKITPGGVLSTIATTTTIGAQTPSLVFDSVGNLFWGIPFATDGTNVVQNSKIFKIDKNNTLTTFATFTTKTGSAVKLIIDQNDTLYCAVANQYDGTTYTQNAVIYKITAAGNLTQLDNTITQGLTRTAIAFDNNKNIIWSIPNYFNGTTRALTSYLNILYRI